MIIPKLIVFDFDGVFTDNAVYVLEDGREMVRCSRADSLGLNLLRPYDLSMVILSTETNAIVSARAKKLGLQVFQACEDKRAFLEKYLRERGLGPEDMLYLGNDLNDLEAMRLAGFAACPADAHLEVKKVCDLVLSAKGGRGAVRELCELLIKTLTPPLAG